MQAESCAPRLILKPGYTIINERTKMRPAAPGKGAAEYGKADRKTDSGRRDLYKRQVSENEICDPCGRKLYHSRRARRPSGRAGLQGAAGKAVKTALELECTACSFELDAASELGQETPSGWSRVRAAHIRRNLRLDGRWEPELACSFTGADAGSEKLKKAWELARSIMETPMVNCRRICSGRRSWRGGWPRWPTACHQGGDL